MLYTDWFLAQVIGQLKGAAQRSAMVYVSDHGQSLYDNSCKLAFHGHNTEFDFHVPALLWYSDRIPGAATGRRSAQLMRHRKARLGTENIFDTLLDLADIRYDDERPEWSFVNQALQAAQALRRQLWLVRLRQRHRQGRLPRDHGQGQTAQTAKNNSGADPESGAASTLLFAVSYAAGSRRMLDLPPCVMTPALTQGASE
jgi:hypothetical protein